MLSLAGATREQMGKMLLDLGCVIVGEEASEDPEKPALQIFEGTAKQCCELGNASDKVTSKASEAAAKVRRNARSDR